MKIEVKKEIGITGKEITLGYAELVVLKDIATSLKKSHEILKNSRKLSEEDRNAILMGMNKTSVVFDKITEGVTGYKDAERELFSSNDIDDEVQKIIDHEMQFHSDSSTKVNDSSTNV